MPTNLTKTEQLTAASNQLKTWLKQEAAQKGVVLGGEYEAKAYDILNRGNYPDLEVAVRNGTTGGFDTIFALPEDIGPYDTIISNNTGAGSGQLVNTPRTNITAQQYTTAINTSPKTTQGSAFDTALTQAYGAQVARQDATPTVELPPASSSETIAASDSFNQRFGQPIDPAADTLIVNQQAAAQAAAQSATEQNQLLAQQYSLRASGDNNTAASSGEGTSIPQSNIVTSPAVKDATLLGADPSITEVGAGRTGFNTVSGVSEDGTNNQSKVDNTQFTDQTPLNNRSLPLGGASDALSEGATTRIPNGNESVTVTSSGKATGVQSPTTAVSNTSSSNTGNSSRVNRLHSYTNYTYRISLYGIPRTTINQIYSKAVFPGNESVLLNGAKFVCADGGSGIGVDRTFFPADLTIDNLELETIVNTSGGRTRATDVIKLKFDIIEPYTVNFLARLQILANSINPGGNWSTTFFVMKIEFLGYNDEGVPQSKNSNGDVIPGTTKFIPFTFINMKFGVTASGGKYSCQAIPVNALGLTGLDNTIPFHAEFQGGTITDLFNAKTFSSVATQTNGTGLDAREPKTQTSVADVTSGAGISNVIVTKGIADALNNHEKDLCKPENKGKKKPTTYEFEFADEIGNASIVDPNVFKEQSAPNTGGKDTNSINLGKQGSITLSTDKRSFRVNGGSKITDLIGKVITVSDYMLNQNTDSGHDTQVLKTWKITPVIQFGDIDSSTNYYQRTVKYVITPYMNYGQDTPGFGQAPVNQSQIVKTYKYIYSGDNRDVIDATVDYNMAFFELKNGVPGQYVDKANDAPGQQQPYGGGGYDGSSDPRFFKPRYHYLRGLPGQQNTGATTQSGKAIAVQDLMEKLYDNRGDMIRLDFTIVGDPDWISQDYAICHPSFIGNEQYLKNGSVNYKNAVFFNFYFATPNTDYDDTSGLFNSAGNYSEFSGIYRVAQVTSTFSGGKFTQKLKNYRVRNQSAPPTNAVRSDSVNGAAPTSSNNAGNSPVAEKPTNTVVAPDTVANITRYTGPLRNDDFRNRGVGATDASGYSNITGARGQGLSEDGG